MKGCLYLIPTPLGEMPLEYVIPEGTLAAVTGLKYFAVEELRSGRRYLSKAGFKGKIDSLELYLLNEHTKEEELGAILSVLERGENVGLLSEAGLPAVADPGANLVMKAHTKGIKVVPFTGPSSLMLALMASGKNGQNFSFIGYLPVKSDERRSKIKELEKHVARSGQSQIMIETPYRNNALLADFLQVCSDVTTLTVAAGITTGSEFIATKTIAQWKKETPELNKIPCVFIL